jgi:hypothetical protein
MPAVPRCASGVNASRSLVMKIRVPALATVFALVAIGCSGRVNADSSDGGTLEGGAGSGGVTMGAGGQTNTAGSAAVAGRMNTGGTGGSAGAGGGASGGAAGNSAGGAQCPVNPPNPQSPCPSWLQGNCSYGGGCCGLILFCDANHMWEELPLGCACQPPPLPPVDAGPITCGMQTCSANEVCVQPAYNLCGPQPPCVPELDGGACPSGTMRMDFCNGSSSGGCVRIPKPGPPHCAAMPSSCGSTPSCGCLPSDICGPNGVDVCSAVRDRHVDCLCTAP